MKLNADDRMIDLAHGEEYPLVLATEKRFKQAVAEKHGVDPELVIPNNGSNGSLLTVFSYVRNMSERALSSPRVLLDLPNYFRTVDLIRLNRCNRFDVRRDEDLEFNAEQFVDKMIKCGPELVVLTTPNNPTGKPIPDEDLDRIVSSLPENSVAVIDRTLVNLQPEMSTNELLGYEGTVVVLHSFSKSHHLSAQRIGYALTNNYELAGQLRVYANLGFNVDAMLAGIEALADEQTPKMVRQRIRESLDVFHGLDGFRGVRCYASSSNYGVMDLPPPATPEGLYEFMRAKGVSVMIGFDTSNLYGTRGQLKTDDRVSQSVRLHMTGKKELDLFSQYLEEYLVEQIAL